MRQMTLQRPPTEPEEPPRPAGPNGVLAALWDEAEEEARPREVPRDAHLTKPSKEASRVRFAYD